VESTIDRAREQVRENRQEQVQEEVREARRQRDRAQGLMSEADSLLGNDLLPSSARSSLQDAKSTLQGVVNRANSFIDQHG
jgi:FKBP-type peptidyl-prolyl cis-trans isomerase (trigger factor)